MGSPTPVDFDGATDSRPLTKTGGELRAGNAISSFTVWVQSKVTSTVISGIWIRQATLSVLDRIIDIVLVAQLGEEPIAAFATYQLVPHPVIQHLAIETGRG